MFSNIITNVYNLKMTSIYLFQFFIFSICINLFSIFTYLIYYNGLLTSTLFRDIHTEYDYIIVGSGTAGSLIAHRLSQTNYTFIVLEAGGISHHFHDIPAFGPLLHGSVFDWGFETVPQNNACFAMEGHKCKLFQGKIFGGSSKMNNMVHVRGNISHYTEWFHGKYTEEYIEEQFKYIESDILKLGTIQYDSVLGDALLNVTTELGFEELIGFGHGFMKAILTQNNGKRWTTSDHLDISNVLTNVLVEKLLIENNKCIGVQINNNKLFARNGVILSAGTFNSPKILQLSGIGPKEVLQSLNIPVLKDLPVGKNLQDHIGTGLDLVLFDKPQSITTSDIINLLSVFEYFYYGKGPLTSTGCEVVGFISTKNLATPDIQYMVLPVGISSDRGSHLRISLGISDEVWNNYFEKVFDKFTATFFPIILHPKSRGEVNIQSKNPNIPPLIDPKYLTDKDDVNTLIEGVKFIKKILKAPSLKAIGAKINNTPFPGCEKYKIFSNLYLKCYVKHLTLTSFHPVGTCSMGLPGSKNAVVDTSFRIQGMKNLYVVDGSVLPTLPSGNINAAIAMMANIFFEEQIQAYRNVGNNDVCYTVTLLEFLRNICQNK